MSDKNAAASREQAPDGREPVPRVDAAAQTVDSHEPRTRRDFTDYLMALRRTDGVPDGAALKAVLLALRRMLRNELHRRGLWDTPPSYLGLVGWPSWSLREDSQGPLAELAVDCYEYIFVVRLQSLQVHLQMKPNIEGVVSLAVRHFVHDRQRHYDPLGFRIFDLVRGGLRGLLASGRARVVTGSPKIRNDTVIVWGQGDGDGSDGIPDVARLADLLMPELLGARGRPRPALTARVQEALLAASGRNGGQFRVKDLIVPLKEEIRARWGRLASPDVEAWKVDGRSDGMLELVRVVGSGTSFEERQAFEALSRCVEYRIRRLDLDERKRVYMSSLWEFLRVSCLDAGPPERIPSLRKLAAQLAVPRKRLPGLLDQLRELITACRGGSGVPAAAAAGGREEGSTQ